MCHTKKLELVTGTGCEREHAVSCIIKLEVPSRRILCRISLCVDINFITEVQAQTGSQLNVDRHLD